MMTTYQGSCHCGAVRFAADIDLRQGTLRCNCSLCSKLRLWPALVAPQAFRLLGGADALADYRCHTGREHHYFCRHCGAHPYASGTSPRWGAFYAVNLPCLDDLPAAVLAGAPVRYVDGAAGTFADTAPFA